MLDSKVDKRIEELRTELDLLGQIEREARARLAGEDESWNLERDRIIDKMFELVVSHKPDDPSHKAVHLLGQLVAEVEKIRAPKRIVLELDTKRKLLHNLQDQRRRYEETKAKAEDAFKAHRLANGN